MTTSLRPEPDQRRRRKQKERKIREFAKASLIKLVAERLSATHPQLLREDARKVDPIRKAHHPASDKRALLERVLNAAGPQALLEIGHGIEQARLDPIWEAALRSKSPDVLFDKWMRYERFAHWNNRVRIEWRETNAVEMFRYAEDGVPPTDAENLLVCGLMIGLLRSIGCQDLQCEMGNGGDGHATVFMAGQIRRDLSIGDLSTDAWTLHWTGVTPRTQSIERDKLAQLVDRANLNDETTAIAHHLAEDPTRSWTIDALAEACGLSSRTLQRRLQESDLNFSKLVRLVRIYETCELLEHSDLPLTAVGFCAGFSDSAHFSRDFSASMGMSPKRYREMVRDPEPN